MSLSGCFWLSAASIGSHQRPASDSQWFAECGVNRLLTRHLEAHFHLNVTVVYLTVQKTGAEILLPLPKLGRAVDGTGRPSWRAACGISAHSLKLPHPCRQQHLVWWPFAVGNNLLVMWLNFLLWPCVYNSACIRCRPRDMRLGAFLRANPLFPNPAALSFVPAVFPSPLEFRKA